ncbi:MAG: MFS transporter [Ilumatobacteraceae bacterium]
MSPPGSSRRPSLSIITTTFAEGERRNRALLVYGGAGAAGFSLGMVVGGLLSAIDWRWVFFAPVLFAALLFAVAVRRVPLDRAVAVPLATAVGGRRVDAIGALTLTAGMLLLVMGVVRARRRRRRHGDDARCQRVALLASFVAVERRSAAPLVRLGIFRSASLVRADLGAMLFVGSFVGFQFIAVLYLQELREWSALETGLALMVAGIDAVIAPTLTPVLVRRYGNLRVLFAGALIAVAAYLAFLPVQDDWAYPMMLPSLILIGLAFSFAFGPLTIAATDGIDESEQGLASGLVQRLRAVRRCARAGGRYRGQRCHHG